MFWADDTVERITEAYAEKIESGTPLMIRDEKTLSGRVHVGSLRGVAIHGIIAQLLQAKGIACRFLFELNDFDPMDSLPSDLDGKKFKPHMGKPLFAVPAPDGKKENFPSFYGEEFKEVCDRLGFPVEYYHLRPLYEEGKFNDAIAIALDHAAEIRRIYKHVSGSTKPDDWHPLNVICECCGKIGTTQVTGWNGKIVTYRCRKDMVSWAEGCDYQGELDPFNGNAKLPWKVEWAAKWKVLSVDIEGAGKDHSAAGGSRDVSARIAEEVYTYRNPFYIPYEFLNVGGKKMSASKGIGASAKEISDMLPATILRLLLLRKLPNQPIDFDPDGTTIPALFDEYDRMGDHYFKRRESPDADLQRKFVIAHPDLRPIDTWQMRFTVLSFILQMPHLTPEEEAGKLKGSALTNLEVLALKDREHYARQWLNEHAPEEYRFEILTSPPEDLKLDADQIQALSRLRTVLRDAFGNGKRPWEGPEIHSAVHDVKKETGIEPEKIFQPLYRVFLGRSSGPQIGWFLSTFERDHVVSFLEQVLRSA